MEVTRIRQWSHRILWEVQEFDSASSGTKVSFKKIPTTSSQLPHGALVNEESWADLGKHF